MYLTNIFIDNYEIFVNQPDINKIKIRYFVKLNTNFNSYFSSKIFDITYEGYKYMDYFNLVMKNIFVSLIKK